MRLKCALSGAPFNDDHEVIAIPVAVWDDKTHITGIPETGVLDAAGRVICDGREVATPESAMIVCAAACRTLMSNGLIPGLRDAIARNGRLLDKIHKAAQADTDPKETAKRVEHALEVLGVPVALQVPSTSKKKEHIENIRYVQDIHAIVGWVAFAEHLEIPIRTSEGLTTRLDRETYTILKSGLGRADGIEREARAERAAFDRLF